MSASIKAFIQDTKFKPWTTRSPKTGSFKSLIKDIRKMLIHISGLNNKI